jgi:hypothetical protein
MTTPLLLLSDRVGTGFALAKAKTLTRVAFYIPCCFLMFLWGTLAVQCSMATLLAQELKCLFTTDIARKHWCN